MRGVAETELGVRVEQRVGDRRRGRIQIVDALDDDGRPTLDRPRNVLHQSVLREFDDPSTRGLAVVGGQPQRTQTGDLDDLGAVRGLGNLS